MQRIAGDGEDHGEDEGVDDDSCCDSVESEAVAAAGVDAVVQDEERKFGKGGRPEVGDA